MEVKMKNSSKKIKYDSRLKSSKPSSLRLYFYIVCFTFLSLRLATSLTGVAFANSAAGDPSKLPQGSIVTLTDPNNIKGLELLRAELNIANSPDNTKSKDQLRKIIEQIRSIEFAPQKQAPEPVVIPEKDPPVEPVESVETVPDVPVQKEQAEPVVESRPKHRPIAESTLQMLRVLANNPQKVANPFELGETLFASGNLKEAAIFYSQALKSTDPNDAGVSRDRAWILFQIGNCLRNDDMPAAAKIYQRLITEYPNSPWVDMATARNNLIAWYLKDEPLKLIQQIKHPGSVQANNK
jgi:tetratricopeptide (TPR) repeat protein